MSSAVPALTSDEVEQFIADGFLRIDEAFPRALADEAREILWRDLDARPDDPSTWTRAVVRLGMYSQPPFLAAANTARLHAAFDRLVGPGLWQPCTAMGTFPVRFPSAEDPGDAGWHIDVSYGTEAPDFLDWRANVHSKGRALLMLFLFSDVGDDDAPTRIRVGSHVDVARRLAPAGVDGLSLRELVAGDFGGSAQRDVVLATGEAGTVYLCHPFLVHAAQPHRGRVPRFLAQPPLRPTDPENRTPGDPLSRVKEATRRALV